MQISKELEKKIDGNVPFETKEKLYNQIRTNEDFRKWRLERLKQVTGIEFEDIEIDGTKYRFIKEKDK